MKMLGREFVIVLRIKYKKINNMKFLSHLELIKSIERVFRRMNLPMKFSQGFNPKPKISYAAPLPVGVESECEFLDVELTEKIDVKEMIATQKDFMPNGIVFLEGRYFEKVKKLMSVVSDSTYIISIITKENYSKEQIIEKLNSFLSREEINYEKLNKKKQLKIVNIRSLISYLEVLTVDNNMMIFKALVTTGSNGNLKPEKLAELFCEFEEIESIEGKDRYKRIELFTRNKNGKLISLFEV